MKTPLNILIYEARLNASKLLKARSDLAKAQAAFEKAQANKAKADAALAAALADNQK